jgi:hypothetical protein
MLMKAEEERRFAIGRSGDGKFSDGNLSNTGCHFIGSVYWPVLVKPATIGLVPVERWSISYPTPPRPSRHR